VLHWLVVRERCRRREVGGGGRGGDADGGGGGGRGARGQGAAQGQVRGAHPQRRPGEAARQQEARRGRQEARRRRGGQEAAATNAAVLRRLQRLPSTTSSGPGARVSFPRCRGVLRGAGRRQRVRHPLTIGSFFFFSG